MAAKQGERHHKARLTPRQVIDLRAMYRAGGWSFMRLAEHMDYVVAEQTLQDAIRGVTWKHLPGAVTR